MLGWRPKERSPALAPGPFILSVSQRDVINAQTPGRSGLVLYPGAVAGATSSRTMLFPAKTHARCLVRPLVLRRGRPPRVGSCSWQRPHAAKYAGGCGRRHIAPSRRVSHLITAPGGEILASSRSITRAHWRDEHPSSTTRTGLTIASPAPFDTIVLVCNRCWFTLIWQKFGSNFDRRVYSSLRRAPGRGRGPPKEAVALIKQRIPTHTRGTPQIAAEGRLAARSCAFRRRPGLLHAPPGIALALPFSASERPHSSCASC